MQKFTTTGTIHGAGGQHVLGLLCDALKRRRLEAKVLMEQQRAKSMAAGRMRPQLVAVHQLFVHVWSLLLWRAATEAFWTMLKNANRERTLS